MKLFKFLAVAFLGLVSLCAAHSASAQTVNGFDGTYIYWYPQTGKLQKTSVAPILFPSVPTGGCLPQQLAINNATGNLYTCSPTGSWQAAGGGSGFTAGGDLGGSSTSQEVLGLQNSVLPSLFLTTAPAFLYGNNVGLHVTTGVFQVTGSPSAGSPLCFSTTGSDNLAGPCSFSIPPSPTTNQACSLSYIITSNAAVALTCPQAGLGGRTISGATATDITQFNDNETVINQDVSASGTLTQTLHTPVDLQNPLFGYSLENDSSQPATVQPCTSGVGCSQTMTMNGAANFVVPPHFTSRIKVNPFLSTDWLGAAWPLLSAFPNCPDTAGNHLNWATSTGLFTCGTSIPANLGTPTTLVLTNATNLPTAGLQNNAVTSAKMAVVNTRRVCDIPVGDTSASALTNAQLGPQSRVCFIPAAATIVEMDVNADAGTPNVIVGRNHAGTITNIVSAALATAASGAIACSNTDGTTGINGATTCSSTLQNTSLSAGDYLELVSGTAGGTAKFFVAHVIYTVN